MRVTDIESGWYQVTSRKGTGWVRDEELPEIARAARHSASRPPPSVLRASARAHLASSIRKALAPKPEQIEGWLKRVDHVLATTARPLDLLLHHAALVLRGSSQARQDLDDLVDVVSAAEPVPPRPRGFTLGLGKASRSAAKLPPLDALDLNGPRSPAIPCLFFGDALGRIFRGFAATYLAVGRKPEDAVVQDGLYRAFTLVDRAVGRLVPLEYAMRCSADLGSPAARERFLDVLEVALRAAESGGGDAGDGSGLVPAPYRAVRGDFGPGRDDSDRWPWPSLGAFGDLCRWQRADQFEEALGCGVCPDRYRVTAIVNHEHPTLGARVCPGGLLRIEGEGFGDRETWESGGARRDHVVFPGRPGAYPIPVEDNDSYSSWTDTSIVVRVPAGAASGQIELALKCRHVSGPHRGPCVAMVPPDDGGWIIVTAAPDLVNRPRYWCNLDDVAGFDGFRVVPLSPGSGERTPCRGATLEWRHRYLRSVVLRGPSLPATGLVRSYESAEDGAGFLDGMLRTDSVEVSDLPPGDHTLVIEGTTVCGASRTGMLVLRVVPAPLGLAFPNRVPVGDDAVGEVVLSCPSVRESLFRVAVLPGAAPAGVGTVTEGAAASLAAGESRFPVTVATREAGRIRIVVEERGSGEEAPRHGSGEVQCAITPLIDAAAWRSDDDEVVIRGLGYGDGMSSRLVQFLGAEGASPAVLAEIPADSMPVEDTVLRVGLPDTARRAGRIRVRVVVDGRRSNLSAELMVPGPEVTRIEESAPGGPWKLRGSGLGSMPLRVVFETEGVGELWSGTARFVSPGVFEIADVRPCMAGPGVVITIPESGLRVLPPRLSGPFEPVEMVWNAERSEAPQAASTIGNRMLALFVEGRGGDASVPNATVTCRRADPGDSTEPEDWEVTVRQEVNLDTGDGAAGLRCQLVLNWNLATPDGEARDHSGPELRRYQIHAFNGLDGSELGLALAMAVDNSVPGSGTTPGHVRGPELFVSPDRTLLMAVGASRGPAEYHFTVWDLASGARLHAGVPRGQLVSSDDTNRNRIAARVESGTDGAARLVIALDDVDQPPVSLPPRTA